MVKGKRVGLAEVYFLTQWFFSHQVPLPKSVAKYHYAPYWGPDYLGRRLAQPRPLILLGTTYVSVTAEMQNIHCKVHLLRMLRGFPEQITREIIIGSIQ